VQYYAHPRNVFWPIMADLFSIDAETDYARRIAQISEAPVILWDTLKRCERPGSLDASIRRDTVEANDIPGLLVEYPGIRAVACNGATSANYFRRLVMPQISAEIEIELLPMPSTSPANAGMSFEQKLAAWRRLLDYID
jgi:TDG/mug DNA glycosylase family protein